MRIIYLNQTHITQNKNISKNEVSAPIIRYYFKRQKIKNIFFVKSQQIFLVILNRRIYRGLVIFFVFSLLYNAILFLRYLTRLLAAGYAFSIKNKRQGIMLFLLTCL